MRELAGARGCAHPELRSVPTPTDAARMEGSAPSAEAAGVVRAVPMLSLANAFSDEEIAGFRPARARAARNVSRRDRDTAEP